MSSRGKPVTKQIKAQRRKFAEEHQAEYDKLTLQQKIDRLPPEPQAKKQRARLLALQEKSKKQVETPKQVETVQSVTTTTTSVEVEKSYNKKSKKK